MLKFLLIIDQLRRIMGYMSSGLFGKDFDMVSSCDSII